MSRAAERIARGLAYNAAYQIVEAGLALGAMLVLVRVIPQEEYGRFSVVVGILTVLNAFGFAAFAAHALQEPDGREPDWSLHLAAGLHVQLALALVCQAVAAACWLRPTYRPVAPLLHLAAAGFALDWLAQLRAVMLKRALDFRRLKLLSTASTLLKLGVTLALGLNGWGAYALVLGGNVLTAAPLALDLLLARGVRLRPGWWHPSIWRAYRPAVRFGAQQAGSGLIAAVRGGLEAAVLPYAVGYASIGLLDRARAILGSTVGRAGNVLIETVYPLLPRSAALPGAFARHATLFVQALLLVVVPGALYVGLEGPSLSRLGYGTRWVAADLLIWPAALAAIGTALFGAGAGVLLAASRLRACLALDVALAAVCAPMLLVASGTGDTVAYAWTLAAGQLVTGAVALGAAARRLQPGWVRVALLPPLAASLAGGGAVLAARGVEPPMALAVRVAAHAVIYGIAASALLRGAFPRELGAVVERLPAGERLCGWLGLAPGAARPARGGW